MTPMTPYELEAHLGTRPTQATVRALLARMVADPEWSAVSATVAGRVVWAEFTHRPSRTVLALTPEELAEDTRPATGAPPDSGAG